MTQLLPREKPMYEQERESDGIPPSKFFFHCLPRTWYIHVRAHIHEQNNNRKKRKKKIWTCEGVSSSFGVRGSGLVSSSARKRGK